MQKLEKSMGLIFKLFGILFFIFGITIIFNSFQGMTGFVVYEDVNLKIGFIIGAWFVLTSLFLISHRKKEKEDDKRK